MLSINIRVCCVSPNNVLLIHFHCPETPIRCADTTFCKLYARSILATSPVEYIKNMDLRGSLFDDDCSTGVVSSAFTSFYVDHNEPLEALKEYKRRGGWVLGELLDGHEFLIILPTLVT
jgi:hypothetical protein